MANWRELVSDGKYFEAEPSVLAETDLGAGFFPDNEIRASFYENWGDRLAGEEKIAKYNAALVNWQQFASCSTSGGEGTARMLDVTRVRKKLEALNADR